MALTLIIGPVKSGKSLELIARVAPYEFAHKKVLYVQPQKDVRGEGISSRAGVNAQARRAATLKEITDDFDVIGIDEVHMLPPEDTAIINAWLLEGKEIVASGLDLDYRGTLMPMTHQLLQLGPDQMINKVAVCEVCHGIGAQFTQILHEGKIVLKGLPPVVPEDGTYTYQARCRPCFERV